MKLEAAPRRFPGCKKGHCVPRDGGGGRKKGRAQAGARLAKFPEPKMMISAPFSPWPNLPIGGGGGGAALCMRGGIPNPIVRRRRSLFNHLET